jgi:hypothetical protein
MAVRFTPCGIAAFAAVDFSGKTGRKTHLFV